MDLIDEYAENMYERILFDLKEDEESWGDLTLGQLYAKTYSYLDPHSQRRELLLRVLDRLIPNW